MDHNIHALFATFTVLFFLLYSHESELFYLNTHAAIEEAIFSFLPLI